MAEPIKITVRGWSEYNPRKDFKSPRWFALSNRLLEDPDFFSFDGEEFKAWIYILSQCSQKNSATVTINFDHAQQVCRISVKKFNSAILKLQVIGIIENVQMTNANVQIKNGSVLHITEQNNTEQNNTIHSLSVSTDLPQLIKIWNDHSGPLEKVRKTNANRNKLIIIRFKDHTEDEWVEIVKRIALSRFCVGENDRGWKATFDWLLKPDTALRVIEGKYDFANKKTFRGERDTNPDDEIAQIYKDVFNG